MGDFDKILDYVEENINPKVFNIFENLVGDDFEEALTLAYLNHKRNGSKLETEMSHIAARYR